MKKYASIGVMLLSLLIFLGWQLKGAFPFSTDESLSAKIDLETEDTYLKIFSDFKKSELISGQEPNRRRSVRVPRDPFTFPTQQATQSSAGVEGIKQTEPWRVTGILWDERDPGAVVNSKVVRVNSRIGSYRVVSILPEKVVLTSGHRKLVLNMPRRITR